mmetsp:Transcript_20667/g.24837  ORF Transcript_20667/g.24837 Transcript_20667/m.24837 type:complete len:284 (+) Transcript_20667:232-1083(+)
MTTLKGHTVLLTGATSGIGLGIAERIAAKELETLVLVSRTKSTLEALAQKLEADFPTLKCVTIPQDLSKPGGAQAVYDSVRSQGLDISILIPNAGVARAGRFEDHEVDAYEKLLELNVKSTVTLTRLFIPSMLDKGRGGVLFVSSVAGYAPVPLFTVYAASKAMVTSFAEALHEEYRSRGLTILCVTPGGTTSKNFEKEAGMKVKDVSIAGSIRYPQEDCSYVGRCAVDQLESAMSAPWWRRLSCTAFTSTFNWAVLLSRFIMPRWALARIQMESIRTSVASS